ncbi:hypothetical protein TcWFU_001062 [Taenia crassiceps]|uniref:Uncharacterized protein n=1 Tax=Taenia crassiceps TaxID=6207 RepID=A0ABR4Q6A1_9CEST
MTVPLYWSPSPKAVGGSRVQWVSQSCSSKLVPHPILVLLSSLSAVPRSFLHQLGSMFSWEHSRGLIPSMSIVKNFANISLCVDAPIYVGSGG